MPWSTWVNLDLNLLKLYKVNSDLFVKCYSQNILFQAALLRMHVSNVTVKRLCEGEISDEVLEQTSSGEAHPLASIVHKAIIYSSWVNTSHVGTSCNQLNRWNELLSLYALLRQWLQLVIIMITIPREENTIVIYSKYYSVLNHTIVKYLNWYVVVIL